MSLPLAPVEALRQYASWRLREASHHYLAYTHQGTNQRVVENRTSEGVQRPSDLLGPPQCFSPINFIGKSRQMLPHIKIER
jgi:hypothetical protein